MCHPGNRRTGTVSLGSAAQIPIWPAGRVVFAALVFTLPGQLSHAEGKETDEGEIVVWHAYRGEEQKAFEKVLRRIEETATSGLKIRALSVPFEIYTNKIANAIPRGHGPDLFIFAQEMIGDWARSGLILPLASCGDRSIVSQFLEETIPPLCRDGKLYAFPLAFKSLALFYNTSMVARPPETMDALLKIASKFSDPAKGRYGLAMETGGLYHLFPFLSGFGGGVKDADGRYNLATAANAEGLTFLQDLVINRRVVPEESSGALVTQLFVEGGAPLAINGPWFIGEIKGKVPFAVAPLPTIGDKGERMKPFLTVEGVFLSAQSTKMEAAVEVARLLAGEESARIRFSEGFQCVASAAAANVEATSGQPEQNEAARVLEGFYRQLPHTIPMPNDPQMRSMWVPAKLAIGKVIRGENSASQALEEAQRLLLVYTAPHPKPSSTAPYLLAAGLLLLAVTLLLVRRARKERTLQRAWRSRHAYIYLLPGMIAVAVLVFLPFVVGAAVSLFSYEEGRFTFVGLRNFARVLLSPEFGLFGPMSFYTTLLVTVLWTVCNVTLHVTLGVGIALLLERPWAKLRPIYRVLLIIPWAIPNYITALIWKGMFHRQLGTINALLDLVGIEPISWFSQFSTAFAANLITNTWLGFPFMMVVTLGALQAIPKEIEESARIDGASPWTIFWKIKLPLLRPALLPAVLLGTVWTFNMFNVIYLVSGGEPGGATDILISEAYRWAFEMQERYGYAAAYAVLIFGILLFMSRIQERVLGRRRGEDAV